MIWHVYFIPFWCKFSESFESFSYFLTIALFPWNLQFFLHAEIDNNFAVEDNDNWTQLYYYVEVIVVVAVLVIVIQFLSLLIHDLTEFLLANYKSRKSREKQQM